MNTDIVIELALRCYPGWWKDRYAEEVRLVSHDLTAEGRSPVKVALNLMRGALRTRTRAQGMPTSYQVWSTRTRTSVATATLPWLLVAPFLWVAVGSERFHSSAGLVFWSGFSGFPTHLQIIQHARIRSAPPLTSAGQLILYSNLAIAVLMLVTFMVLISGWCGLTRGIRHTDGPDRRRLRLFAWAPVFALLVDLMLLIADDKARPTGYAVQRGRHVTLGGHPSALHLLNIALPIVAIVGWLVSVVCVSVAAKRADVPPVELRLARSVAVVVASLFVLLVAAYATWGIGLSLQSRQSRLSSFTTVGYAHAGLWIPMMLVLVMAVTLSVVGARTARESWSMIRVSFL